MITKPDKNQERKWRAKRTSDIHGTKDRPRLSVYRSLNHVYAQIIDDDKGVTLVACNTKQKEMAGLIKGKTKKEQAFIIGQELGKMAKAKKITTVVFDRNGYVYHGRIAQVADGARDAGLKF
ncbi:MAG: 50S ribosomal protein L18 [Firmicutes bacterium]|nr:50S ribosomal protein L18 [Bacillota bacterium]